MTPPDPIDRDLPPAFPAWLVRMDPTLAGAEENPIFEAFRRRRSIHGRRGVKGVILRRLAASPELPYWLLSCFRRDGVKGRYREDLQLIPCIGAQWYQALYLEYRQRHLPLFFLLPSLILLTSTVLVIGLYGWRSFDAAVLLPAATAAVLLTLSSHSVRSGRKVVSRQLRPRTILITTRNPVHRALDIFDHAVEHLPWRFALLLVGMVVFLTLALPALDIWVRDDGVLVNILWKPVVAFLATDWGRRTGIVLLMGAVVLAIRLRGRGHQQRLNEEIAHHARIADARLLEWLRE